MNTSETRIARKVDFLDTLPLPSYGGLRLGVTGTRALEHYSDLASGKCSFAHEKDRERLDLIDDCLDVVLLDDRYPSAFTFAGLSLAQLWWAVERGAGDTGTLEAWRARLTGSSMEQMRNAARARVRVMPRDVFLQERRLNLPRALGDSLRMEAMPQPLLQLMEAARPDWSEPRRCRFAVALACDGGYPGEKLPPRGRLFPKVGDLWSHDYYKWTLYRLQPRLAEQQVATHEFQLALPSLEESYFSPHFFARNVFAHFRVTVFSAGAAGRVMLLDEVQSDWVNALRRQRRGDNVEVPYRFYDKLRPSRDYRVPECPLEKQWLEELVEYVLQEAEDRGVDCIAWTPGAIQAELNPKLPLSAAQTLYDRRLPRAILAALGTSAAESRVEIVYPTYTRDALIESRRGKGFCIVRPDSEMLESGFPYIEAEVLKSFARYVRPVDERLPGVRINRRPDTDADAPFRTPFRQRGSRSTAELHL